MAIIPIVLGIAWFIWWIRGSIWPALMVPAACAVFEWGSYTDGGNDRHFDPPGAFFFFATISAIAFIPYAVNYIRARRTERLLHGVNFLGRD